MRESVKVKINGVWYDSLRSAAIALGVNRHTLRWHLNKGKAGYEWGERTKRSKEESYVGRPPTPVMAKGVLYESLFDARMAGHDYNTIMRRCARNVEGYKILTQVEYEQLKAEN